MSVCKALNAEDLKPGRAVVLVDELGYFSQALVRRSAAKGQLVIFRRAALQAQKSAWFETAAKEGHLCEFNDAPFHSFDEYWRADDKAFDVVEQVCATLKRRGMVPVEALSGLYDADTIESACKKNLLMKLAEFFRSLEIARRLVKEGLEVGFHPSPVWEDAEEWLALSGVRWDWPEHAQIERSAWAWQSSFDWLKWAGILALLPFWVLMGVRRVGASAVSPKRVPVAFRVYTTDWCFGGWQHDIDWLIDGKGVRGDTTLFVIEKPIAAQYRDEFSKRNYRVHDLSGREAFRSVSLKFFRELLIRGLRVWAGLFLVAPRTPAVFLEVAARGWLEYIRWTAFLEHWRPRHYVAYNHFHYDHVFRNILLRKAGCQSWYYVHSVHDRCAFLHASPGGPLRSQIGWTYLSYDHEVHWGRRDADLYRRMSGKSRHYLVWGPLWSGEVRPDPQLMARLNERRAKGSISAVVAVFDTSFSAALPFENSAAKEFFGALAELLERPEWSSRLLLYKPKNDLDSYLRAEAAPEVVAALDSLLDHPRCMLIGSGVTSGAVIFESDLTVSMAYTSTTVEALGARRRAIYYDPCGKFRESYYEQFPNLVAHDREELARLCNHWLSMSEADFQKYLDEHVAPEFGGCLDSGAVARFREALSRA